MFFYPGCVIYLFSCQHSLGSPVFNIYNNKLTFDGGVRSIVGAICWRFHIIKSHLSLVWRLVAFHWYRLKCIWRLLSIPIRLVLMLYLSPGKRTGTIGVVAVDFPRFIGVERDASRPNVPRRRLRITAIRTSWAERHCCAKFLVSWWWSSCSGFSLIRTLWQFPRAVVAYSTSSPFGGRLVLNAMSSNRRCQCCCKLFTPNCWSFHEFSLKLFLSLHTCFL